MHLITSKMSHKNILQEYCQSHKLKIPKYSSTSSGPPHKSDWFATVSLELPNKNIYVTTSIPCSSKIAAEQAAAEIILNQIKEVKKVKQIKSSTGSDLFIIDLENKPCFNKNPESNQHWIGFHNELHHSMSKYIDWHLAITSDIQSELSKSNKILYTIKGGTANLVDHFMTMFVWPITFYLSKNPINTLYIVSGDTSSFCTKKCLKKAIKMSGLNLQTKIEIITTIC